MIIHSSGIIPFRERGGVIEYFVGHPGGTHRNYWAFLKGHMNDGEDSVEAAIREFTEESGVGLPEGAASALIPLGTVMQNPRKCVTAFAINYGDICPSDCFSNMTEDGVTPEIDRYDWFTYEELRPMTHPSHLVFYETIENLYKDGSEEAY